MWSICAMEGRTIRRPTGWLCAGATIGCWPLSAVRQGLYASCMDTTTGSRIHLIGGEHVDVDNLPEDAAKQLNASEGYAGLQCNAKPILVNPAAVAYIEQAPSKGSSFS